MEDWARAMLAVQAGLPPATLNPDIADAHAPALAEASKVRATKSNVGSAAPIRLAEMCLAFAGLTKTLSHPWSEPQAEAFVLDMMQRRLSPNPPLGWNKRDDLHILLLISIADTRLS